MFSIFFVLLLFSIGSVRADECQWSAQVREISHATQARSTFYYDLIELSDEPMLWSETLTEDLGFQHFNSFIRS